jgi:hypothetical protein
MNGELEKIAMRAGVARCGAVWELSERGEDERGALVE